MLNSMLKVEEVEVEFDRAFHLSAVHVAVLPVERRDRRAVAPIDTVFVVPRDLLAGTRITVAGFFRKGRPATKPAISPFFAPSLALPAFFRVAST